MFNIFGKTNKNVIDHINYRSTIMTGEVTADNGDGTYNVRINKASSAYPNVEPINYDAVYLVGEIVDIIFEYGCRESPKIIGHSKKILQSPIEVEVDYSDYVVEEEEEEAIDIGEEAIDRLSLYGAGKTLIIPRNAANVTGTITIVKVHASVKNLTGAKVAIFTQVDTNTFTVRDSQVLDNGNGSGVVVFGSVQTFTVDLEVVEGDFIGIYFSDSGMAGGIDYTEQPALELGFWYLAGDQTSCVDTIFNIQEDVGAISLYGTNQE